ncbi:M14 family zinc carboxypeptidase [Kouleothrix sp.]|uniref:M14 family zinc carboxypeptidase n=1 Tax=Kouleothrix sp. TaxID=2779161 RepID=UPI00391C97D5
MRLPRFATCLLLVLLLALAAPLARPPLAAGAGGQRLVLRVYYHGAAERDRLLATLATPDHAVQPAGYLLAYGDTSTLGRLRAAGLRAEIDQARTDDEARPAAQAFDGGYLTVDELYANLRAAVASHPAIAELVDAGDSWCKQQGGCPLPSGQSLAGDDLLAVHITNRSIAGPKPVAFWVAAHHSRELHTTEIALRYIHWLLDNYGSDADATWMTDDLDIWVIPLGNPDGRRLTEMGGDAPYWQRKNLNVADSAPWSACAWPPTAYTQSGVDLNRNHSFHWRSPNGGWDSAPCGQTYPGALARGAASEPEVQGYTALASSLLIDQRGPGDADPAPDTATGIFVSLHSGTSWLLIPYDWTSTPSPNLADLTAVWGRVAQWTPGWPACQTGPCYGITAGTAADWAYGTFGVAASIWEIGDFMPPYAEVDGYYWPFLRPMMIYTTRIARAPYREARGPDARPDGAELRPQIGWPATVSATIDDTLNGDRPIASAELYIDTPPWAGGTPVAMAPLDGAFDSPVEQVVAQVQLCAQPGVRHMLFVRGADADGNTGPVFARFAGPCAGTPRVFVPLAAR